MATVTIEKAEETGVKAVRISVKNSVNNVQVTITKLDKKPASVVVDVEGKVYHYLSIDKENIADEDISAVNISFQVEKSWINNNNIDKATVALQRYEDGGCSKLPTYQVDEDAVNIYYEAQSPTLSIYAITGETITPTPTPTPTATPTPT
ncbi:TPA: PGF-pre-PGF domain-containing protein, partial [Candidatus Bathyarchaeota archaeon]|nr:PGF-pre-PGF domain-containing protein [Candidatus Bathyarchaeota archaeon]